MFKLTFKEKILPGYISFDDPRYIKSDNIISTGLFAVDYGKEYKDLILKDILNSNITGHISIFLKKQDKYKEIKDITNYIGVTEVDKDESYEDIDIITGITEDARYIRRKLQIDSEELFGLTMYVKLSSHNEKDLNKQLNNIKNICLTNSINVKNTNYRQKELFQSTTPFCNNSKILKNVSERKMLTEAVIGFYPFINNSFYDEKGVLFGTNVNNKNIVILDRFDRQKYKNGNMCIFGTSGSGKSYFTKIQIIRERLLNRYQYIIDPEREYGKLCKDLKGEYIKFGKNSKSFINILDIKENELKKDLIEAINEKIYRLKPFFKEIFKGIKEEEYNIFEESLKQLYLSKLKNIKKIEKEKNTNTNINTSEHMPILKDVYNMMLHIENNTLNSNIRSKNKENKEKKQYSIYLRPFIQGSLSFFNNKTNINIENKLIVADIYDLEEDNIKYGIYLFLDYFWDLIRTDIEKEKIIYIDEIWKLIGVSATKETAQYVYKLFKTIRKYNGCAVAITQDISDVFSLDEGNFGKTILNNSSFKSIFSLNDENIYKLSEFMFLGVKEKVIIRSLIKGECFFSVDNKNMQLKISPSNKEKEIINE